MVDARLPDGSRVNAIIPPLSLCGPAAHDPQVLEEAADARGHGPTSASLSDESVDFLQPLHRGPAQHPHLRRHRLRQDDAAQRAVGGDPRISERIVTIEDAAELQLHQRHVLRLEARPKNIEGEGEIPIRDLVRNSLRMRPDRIIVGEVRGAEALDMLQAMNTGHDGSLSTVHANSAARRDSPASRRWC